MVAFRAAEAAAEAAAAGKNSTLAYLCYNSIRNKEGDINNCDFDNYISGRAAIFKCRV